MKIVFQVNEEGGGVFSIVCHRDKIEITEGEMENFDGKITYKDFETLMKILSGEISEIKAFRNKLFTISGSQSSVRKFGKLVKA